MAPRSPGTSTALRKTPEKPTSSGWSAWISDDIDLIELSVEISELDGAVSYDFEVAAVNAKGRGTAYALSAETQAIAPTRAPSLSATLGDDGSSNAQITLKWSGVDAAFNGGASITGYQVRFKKSTDTDWPEDADGDDVFVTDTTQGFGTITLPSADETKWTRTHGSSAVALEFGTTYEYQVRAVNDGADTDADGGDAATELGPWSGTASTTTNATTPGAPPWNPDGATAQDDVPVLPKWGIDSTSITLKWAKPDDGGAAITSYEIHVLPVVTAETPSFSEGVDESTVERSDISKIENLPPGREEYTLSGLEPEKGYFFRIRAINNADGDGTAGESPDPADPQDTQIAEVSPWSTPIATATTEAAASGTPDIPTSLDAAAPTSEGTVNFSWMKPAVEGDTPITGYVVQYQRDDDGHRHRQLVGRRQCYDFFAGNDRLGS